MNKSPEIMSDSGFLLEAKEIVKQFPIKSGIGQTKKWLKAVDGVSFGVRKDRIFALVGESGCGKSTVARLILKLLEPTSGNIFFKGQDVSIIRREELKRFRRSVQIVFQDPFASLNPRVRILDALSEPYKIHNIFPRSEIKGHVIDILKKVGMNEEALAKYPHEFSGGQRQRICIARALSVSPELIVADEPLSSLDVSIQAQILNLLQDIKKTSAISMVFISHDLRVVRYLSDEVAVMYLGKIVERGTTEDIFNTPKHPYTELLLSSAPKIKYHSESSGAKPKYENSTDVSSAADVPAGCPFHPRCPKRFDPCDKVPPELKQSGESSVACHLYNSNSF